MLQTKLMKKLTRATIAMAAICILPVAAAHADPITFTFSGIGSGTADGVAFTNAAFTFVFTGDTSNVDASGPPFIRLNGVGGTFTEGSYSATLTPTVSIVDTADPGLDRINFFNSTFDDGLGLIDPALANYFLTTSIGPITVTDPDLLTPTTNGGSFATIGQGDVAITGNTSLTFSADLESTSAVPEPSSIALLTTGIAGIGLLRRRFAS